MERHGWRKVRAVRIGAEVLGAAAAVVLLGGVGGFLHALLADGSFTPSLATLAIAASGTLLALRHRLLAPTAAERRAEDPRQPILYFRSFQTDAARILSRGGDRFEKSLETELSRLGPFLAIGNPEDRLPPAGAARLYVPADSDWRVEVERLLREAQLVVFRAEAELSENVRWELGRIIATVDPQSLLIAPPRPTRQATNAQLAYRAFVASAGMLFPRQLPAWRADGAFLAFDADWQPHWLVRGDSYGERNADHNDAAATLRRWLDARSDR